MNYKCQAYIAPDGKIKLRIIDENQAKSEEFQSPIKVKTILRRKKKKLFSDHKHNM